MVLFPTSLSADRFNLRVRGHEMFHCDLRPESSFLERIYASPLRLNQWKLIPSPLSDGGEHFNHETIAITTQFGFGIDNPTLRGHVGQTAKTV